MRLLLLICCLFVFSLPCFYAVAQSGSAPAAGVTAQPSGAQQSSAQQAATQAGGAGPSKTLAPETGKASATTNVNSSELKTGDAVATRGSLPPVVPGGRPVIGIALEGGGALGLAHIGVLRWLEENHVPVDRLSGTSMGALVGALYASGHSPAELDKIATDAEFEKLFYFRSPYDELSYRRREDEREFPQVLTLGLKGGPSLRNAFFSDSPLNDFLDDNFSRYNNTDLKFDEFPIPFRCVSTDLNTLQRVVFEGGPLPAAVRASISIPGVFSPVIYHDHFLVDGSVMDNLPTDIVRKDLRSDVVIGVHLVTTEFSEGEVSSVFGVLSRAFSAGSALNERLSEKQADILISVDTGKFAPTDYDSTENLIKAGYQAAAKNADALRRYSLSDADWQQYLADRASRVRPKPATLQVVKIEGSTPKARGYADYQFRKLDGQPISPDKTAEAIHRITGNGTEQATYETFQPQATGAVPTGAASGQAPDTGIRVRLSPVRSGPPYLDIGFDATAATSNVTRTTFDFRLENSAPGGYGSEIRTDVRLGFLTQLASEYYYQLNPEGYFFEPKGGILRQPVYLWQDQKRISEHLEQQAGGGLEFGRTFNRNLQASVDYGNQVVRWHPVTGSDGTVPVSGDAQTAEFHIKLDTSSSGLAPAASGVRMELHAGALFNTIDSENAPVVEFSAAKPFRISDSQSAFVSVDANSYLRRNVTEPLLFTLGGPLRLSASSIDEYRGTDDYLVRTGYSHRIATLPSGVGQGLYVSGGYEGAEMWSVQHPAFVRQDGFLTLIGAFPIGDLTVGGAAGDAGRRKFFLTFGRLF